MDRVWPSICERCSSRGLLCSEPGGTRNRARLDNPQMMSSARPVQVTPQRDSIVSSNRQPQSILDNDNAQSTSVAISDDASLSILSHAAAIHQTDTPLASTFLDTNEDDSMRRERVNKQAVYL